MKTFWKSVGAISVVVGTLVASQAAEAKLKVAMVTSESGLGDRSFNDMMNEGMKRAQKELNSVGLTSVRDPGVVPSDMRIYQALWDSGEMT